MISQVLERLSGHASFVLIALCLLACLRLTVCDTDGHTPCSDYLQHCTCTETLVNCTNARLIRRNATMGLKKLVTDIPTVQTVILHGNSIGSLEANLFGTCVGSSTPVLSKLKTISLSGNEIEEINGKALHCVPNLEILDLSHNNWYADPNRGRVFSSIPKLKKLILVDAFTEKDHNGSTADSLSLKDIFHASNLTELEELHLQDNNIARIAEDTFCDLPNLKKLYLSNNRLTTDTAISFKVDCMSSLQELYLDQNQISRVPKDITDTWDQMHSLQHIALADNTFTCDCGGQMPDFLMWIKDNDRLVNEVEMTCWAPSNQGTPLLNMTKDILDHNCRLYQEPVHAAQIVLGILLAIICIAIIVAIYINRDVVGKKFSSFCQPCLQNGFGRAHRHGYSNVINT